MSENSKNDIRFFQIFWRDKAFPVNFYCFFCGIRRKMSCKGIRQSKFSRNRSRVYGASKHENRYICIYSRISWNNALFLFASHKSLYIFDSLYKFTCSHVLSSVDKSCSIRISSGSTSYTKVNSSWIKSFKSSICFSYLQGSMVRKHYSPCPYPYFFWICK